MATLEALAISGIRSYNPEKLQRIDFTHPITLINGKNGSGKTVTVTNNLDYHLMFEIHNNRSSTFISQPIKLFRDGPNDSRNC